ncbi:tensin-4-like isoform X2 [Brachionus plicatilis]|uniref:Tensin-4-like isoform X2 n=1 Tax=Brachionus plicatilis TaxID=10195 RepID=A0A3M7QMA8_BRAPC|nr:tensin-4-like isoform X2 [Brachionus plicatilis]
MKILKQIKSKLSKMSFEKLESSEDQREWYKEKFSRIEAEEFLIHFEIGGFVVRQSESVKNAFVLSVKVPVYFSQNRVCHYIIVQCKNRIKFKGYDDKDFKNIDEMIMFCSNFRSILPVKLDSEFYESKIRSKYFRSNSLESVSSNISDFCDLDEL